MPSIAKGTRCLRCSTFKLTVPRKVQLLEIRRLTSDGAKAIVHHVVNPAGMVEAVEVSDLIWLDGEFWVPKSKVHEQ